MSRRGLLAVITIAVAAIVTAVVVVQRAVTSRPQRLPVVEQLWVNCPAWSGGPPATAPPGNGQLLPDADYHTVFVCGDGETHRVRARMVSNEDARALASHLNALPLQRPTTGCATQRGALFDAVFTTGAAQLVVQLDSAPCGVVHRAGVSRYGGDQAYRTLTRYIDTGRI